MPNFMAVRLPGVYRTGFSGHPNDRVAPGCPSSRGLSLGVGPRLRRRSLTERLDQPLRVVAGDELPDDRPRGLQVLESVEIEALLLQRPHVAETALRPPL